MKPFLIALYYLASVLSLLLMPRRLGLSYKRIAAQWVAPALIFATFSLAAGMIVPIEGRLGQIPLLLFLFGLLFVEGLIFFSAPLILTALAVEMLRVRRHWRPLPLLLAAALLTPLSLWPLELSSSYVAAITLCELLLIAGMEFCAKRP